MTDRPVLPPHPDHPKVDVRPLLFDTPICVLDIESTGWFSEKPDRDWARVVELGAVLLDPTGQIISEFSSLVRPDVLDDRAIPALEKNGITPAMLVHAPRAAAVAYTFRHWLTLPDLGAFTPVTSFNVPFDRPFYERLDGDGARMLEWAPCIMLSAYNAASAEGRVFRDKTGRVKKTCNLQEACGWLGVPLPERAHRALDDARAAAGVLVAIARWAPERDEQEASSRRDEAATIDLNAVDYTGASDV